MSCYNGRLRCLSLKLKVFFGLTGYYRKFIEGFSKLELSLTQLTQKGQAYVWEVHCEESFQELNKKLTSAPVFIFLNPSESFVVYYDVLNIGLGGVLMQNGQVVAYTSRQLRVQERNYPMHDLKLETIVFMLEIWRHCLFGLKFKVFSDHRSLKYLYDQKS